MSQDDNFEIDTATPVATALPPTDDAPVEAAGEDDEADDEVQDPRPTWDVEYKAGDGGGVEEIKADTADDARAIFLSRYPEDHKPEVLSVEPG